MHHDLVLQVKVTVDGVCVCVCPCVTHINLGFAGCSGFT